ncbi:conserved hypothetical protein [Coccidioides posadasii str. Silveira]|uniref:Uncharacterized protein n=1 Tax=Coccidioides posadasii (strain RMSCC 757 / Silveira) TaxID=443226 RepID=E9CZ98_COCPS|nr:conserved hypothetical protein [Coccidioides posadasii str. Silveira]
MGCSAARKRRSEFMQSKLHLLVSCGPEYWDVKETSYYMFRPWTRARIDAHVRSSVVIVKVSVRARCHRIGSLILRTYWSHGAIKLVAILTFGLGLEVSQLGVYAMDHHHSKSQGLWNLLPAVRIVAHTNPSSDPRQRRQGTIAAERKFEHQRAISRSAMWRG